MYIVTSKVYRKEYVMTQFGVRDVILFASVWILHASTSFVRIPLGMTKFGMGKELKLSNNKMDMMDTAIMFPCSVVQMYCSRVTDILGPRLTVTICLALTGLSLLSFEKLGSYSTFTLLFALIGALQAFIWPACVKCIASCCPEKCQHLLCGVIFSSTCIGKIVASAVAVNVFCTSGWRSVYHQFSVVLLWLSLWAWLSLKLADKFMVVSPNHYKTSGNMRDTLTSVHNTEYFSDIWRIPMLFELAIAQLCLKFVRCSVYFWFPLYLMEEIGFTSSSFGHFLVVFDMGGVFGSVAFGYICDKENPILISCYAAIFSIIFFLLFWIINPLNVSYNMCFMFVIGALLHGPEALLGGSVPVSIGEHNGSNRGASVVGLINGFGGFGEILSSTVMFFVIGLHSWEFIVLMFFISLLIVTVCLYKILIIQDN